MIMPAYNAEKYIGEAIESILCQTFKKFELIIINDGSTDNTDAIITGYTDPRIVYIINDHNFGLPISRNIGLQGARGEYIGWIDSDDLSLPKRIEKQIQLLDSNPTIGLCGTWVETIGEIPNRIWKYPSSSDLIKSSLLFHNLFATSSVMMRKQCIRQLGQGFDLTFPIAADYELWERISRQWEVTNIEEVLTYYRIHESQISLTAKDRQNYAAWLVQERQLKRVGIIPTAEEKSVHLELGINWSFKSDISNLKKVERWLVKLYDANNIKAIYPKVVFKDTLIRLLWLNVFKVKSDYRNYLKVLLLLIKSKLGLRNAYALRFLSEIITKKLQKVN